MNSSGKGKEKVGQKEVDPKYSIRLQATKRQLALYEL